VVAQEYVEAAIDDAGRRIDAPAVQIVATAVNGDFIWREPFMIPAEMFFTTLYSESII
jgi:hypothetical protein